MDFGMMGMKHFKLLIMRFIVLTILSYDPFISHELENGARGSHCTLINIAYHPI